MDYRIIVKEKISGSELVLIGIGEEFGFTAQSDSSIYKEAKEKNQLILPFLVQLLQKENVIDRIQRAYSNLDELTRDKDRFFITTATDDNLYRYIKDKERIVAPCGSTRRMQCSNHCSDVLEETDLQYEEQIKSYAAGKIQIGDINVPKCRQCGAPMAFNTINTDHYCETGYLTQWEKYMKWLQGTLNKRVCILELGVGLNYPSVIRWPFEKLAYLNQKAYMIRMHSRLYHGTEELKEKLLPVQQNPVDFMLNLFE